jgi:hypothetical protein
LLVDLIEVASAATHIGATFERAIPTITAGQSLVALSGKVAKRYVKIYL